MCSVRLRSVMESFFPRAMEEGRAWGWVGWELRLGGRREVALAGGAAAVSFAERR